MCVGGGFPGDAEVWKSQTAAAPAGERKQCSFTGNSLRESREGKKLGALTVTGAPLINNSDFFFPPFPPPHH